MDGAKVGLGLGFKSVVMGKIADHKQHVYMKAEVIPEQRQSAKPYITWVLLESVHGEVISGGCECVAA